MEVRCPTCKKVLPDFTVANTGDGASSKVLPKHFPFCSKRCQLIDFGAWVDGDYSIAITDDQLEDETTDNY